MTCIFRFTLALALALHAPDQPSRPLPGSPAPAARSAEEIAQTLRQSIVVITVPGRDGRSQAMGTGFVVSPDGLIATNLHVIAEGRPIRVQMADGKHYDAIAVEASDRFFDLAVIRIAAKKLKALELGDSDRLKQGQAVVALGNPRGLQWSVVAGVVSAVRQIEGRAMIQLAIPLEPGNSGGPLVDMQGRVQGIVTMKSQVTNNLGFALAANALKPLLHKPNPIPMSRWLALGALDALEWKPFLGAAWRQRAGRVVVDGVGSGFGGRSFCLWQGRVPAPPLEVSVDVRLDDESGAAGLIFHADGTDHHYGFYPTGGRLRLTRFDGPDVFSWKILFQGKSPGYRPKEWNTLKLRLSKDNASCFVNGALVVETEAPGIALGQVGLAKFRETSAEFRNFRVGVHIADARVPDALAARISASAQKLFAGEAREPALIEELLHDADPSITFLRDRAKELEQQSAQLRKLAQAVHEKRIEKALQHLLEATEEDVDLLRGALLIAKLDNEDVDVDAYHKEVDPIARDIARGLPPGAGEEKSLAALNKYLFQERGFHGSRTEYYSRSNSYLNEVIDDREGLPITLSVLYLEVARRLGLKMEGVGLPGHFVVRYLPRGGEPRLIDVYDGGKALSRKQADQRVRMYAERPLNDADLAASPKRQILARILRNLLGIANESQDAETSLRYLDAILAVDPRAYQERWNRALLRFQNGDRKGALDDTDWILDQAPPGIDADKLKEFRRMFERAEP